MKPGTPMPAVMLNRPRKVTAWPLSKPLLGTFQEVSLALMSSSSASFLWSTRRMALTAATNFDSDAAW
jgi:hypothetical protein